MSERSNYNPKELAPKLAVLYRRLAEINPDHVIIVPGIGALNRTAVLEHLQKADDEGQAIGLHFATNTEKHLIKKGNIGPHSQEAIIEASGERWEEERTVEVRSQEFNHKIRKEHRRVNLLPNST